MADKTGCEIFKRTWIFVVVFSFGLASVVGVGLLSFLDRKRLIALVVKQERRKERGEEGEHCDNKMLLQSSHSLFSGVSFLFARIGFTRRR